ncbi:MAG: serine hydrolase [Bacteroidetes bacterium]|nr:serine hydrolase [Bacteroidota bacterium]MBU1720578.1 serine hydrolase [Bacteroidota bacterium]
MMKMKAYKSILSILLAVVFTVTSLSAQRSLDAKLTNQIDSILSVSLTKWNVPGMAVTIVSSSDVLFSKGYGVTEVGKAEKVDDNTMFAIASNSKAFTSAALAILVDEEKIAWDDKVRNYLPWFSLYDPFVNENMTIRDLLCHRSGLETFSGDLLWYASNYSREEIIRRARFLKPKYGFRTQFGYSNIMFLTAGEIIPVVTGKSWDDFVKERIFKPLGMTRSVTSTKDLAKLSNVASPHTESNGKIIAIPWLNWDNIAPAGAIIASVTDVGKWLMLQLGKGEFNGTRVFSEKASWEMWSPNTILNVSSGSARLWPTTHFKSYGLGWTLNDYRGRKIVSHNGGYDGMISNTVLVPEEDLGFAILTNCNSTLYYPMVYAILDALLNDGVQERDWSGFIYDFDKNNKDVEKQERKEKEEKRVKDSKPTLALELYSGIYTCELYGDAQVSVQSGKLKLELLPSPKFWSVLSHWQYDTFEVEFSEFPSLPKGTATFTIGADGTVDELKVDVPNPDFDFTELKFFKTK